MITVIELPSFHRATKKLLNGKQREILHEMLTTSPQCGDVIQGTGGIRKMRYAIGNKGKSGGVRVIYYYYVSASEILLLTAYAKNKKETLTENEKQQMRILIKEITS